jgi:DNA-binding response OmpR family regulator/sugar-specific transcriptional regulator TrmB
MNNQKPPRILIVDDDEYICRTLSAILQSEGYIAAIATTAKQAIEKTREQFFNLAILDIRLPDMKGTELLAQLNEMTPETIKLMITGYASLQNAVEALNYGADSYMMKPLDLPKLLETIRDKLDTQRKENSDTKEKLAQLIQMRMRREGSISFSKFLEETSNELTNFGLTNTQAKIYISNIALGIASISEIAGLSKIRREEVYRVIPKLEEHGIVARRLGKPNKFSAMQPEKALQLLVTKKLEALQEKTVELMQQQEGLVAKLHKIELPTEKSPCSIEVVSADKTLTKFVEMTRKAKREIKIICSLNELKNVYVNLLGRAKHRLLKSVRFRIITENEEQDAFANEMKQLSEVDTNPLQLKRTDHVPFSLLVVDDSEAMWGKNSWKAEQSLWTNDPTQIIILKTSFDRLWENYPPKRADDDELLLFTSESK